MDDNNKPDMRGGMAGMMVMRVVVCGYLIYLGASLIVEHLRGESTMEPWMVWACGALFVVGGLGFGWYSWKRYRAETRADKDDSE